MTFETVRAIFGWSAIINLVIVTFYFLLFVGARDLIYRLHSRWFTLSKEQLDVILYTVLAFYKVATILLFVVPYLAMRLV